MTIISSLRSHHPHGYQTEATERLIAFRLHQESFTLPVTAMKKVITLDNMYGELNELRNDSKCSVN